MSATVKERELVNDLQPVASYLERKNRSARLALPTYAIVGKQSAGKTLFLSILAGRQIGGPSLSGCATRCRVIYDLSLDEHESCKVAVCNDHSTCPQDQNFQDIRFEDLMGKLSELQGNKFDESRVLHVRIRASSTLPCIIHDLPGCPPGDNAAEKRAVKAMWTAAFQESGVVPLILATPPVSLDVSVFQDDLASIKDFMSSNPQVLQKAYMLVTYLDRFRGNCNEQNLLRIRDKSCEIFGLSRESVFFASLKPHLLSGTVDSAQFATATGAWDYDRENCNVTNALHYEDQFLASFLSSSGLNQHGELQFGIGRLHGAVTSSIVQCIHTNRALVTHEMQDIGSFLISSLRSALSPKDEPMIAQEAVYITHILLAGVEAFLTQNPTAFRQKVRFIQRQKECRHLVFSPNVDEPLPFMSDSAMSFEESREHYRPLLDATWSTSWASDDSIQKIKDAGDTDLSKLLEYKLSGGAAAKRVLEIFKFWVIERELKEYSTEELVNMANFVGDDGVKGPLISTMFRKACNEFKQAMHSEVDGVCEWQGHIFKDGFDCVLQSMSQHCHLLNQYPAVKTYLIKNLRIIHEECFAKIMNDCRNKAYNAIEEHFGTFNSGEIISTMNLIGCIDLPAIEAVMQRPMQVQTSDSSPPLDPGPSLAANSSLSHIPENLEDFLTGNGASNTSSASDGSRAFNGASLTLIWKILRCAPEDWARSEAVPFFGIDSNEHIRACAPQINAAWKTFVRFSFGKCAIRICDIMRSELAWGAYSIPTEMQSKIDRTVLNHFTDQPSEILKQLLAPTQELIDEYEDMITEAAEWLDVAKITSQRLGEVPSISQVEVNTGDMRREISKFYRHDEPRVDI